MIEKYRKDLNYTYVLGIALVIDALKYIPKQVKEVYISSNANHNKEYDMLISLCEKNNINNNVDDKVINHLSNKENCYGIAIIDKYKSNITNEKHIVLKDFNDEGELGTIIRTMASFGYTNLILINTNVDIYNPIVIRSSMGGYFYVNKKLFNTFEEYKKEYNKDVVSIGNIGDKPLNNKVNINDSSLLFGNNNNDYFIKHNTDSNLSLSSIVGISLDLFKEL